MKTLVGIAMLCGLSLLPGCIHHHETVYRDVERTPVEFENDSAARLFYETLEAQPRNTRAQSDTEIKLPLVFEHERKVVSGRNIVFNEAVSKCDTNRDGRITALEARIFAEHNPK